MKIKWKVAVGIMLTTVALVALTQLTGRDIPTEAPEENRRVVHASGFSMVRPTHWDAEIRTETIGTVGPGIYMKPRTVGLPRRHAARLSVSICDDRERLRDQNHMAQDTVAGLSALSRVHTGKVGDGVAEFTYTAFLESDGVWFVVRYHLNADCSVLPATINDYISTFSYSPNSGQP